MTKSDNVTVRELYTLLDNRMTQVNASIERLENKFDSLESGRLTNVEKALANVQGRMMYIPILISVGISLFSIIVTLIIKK